MLKEKASTSSHNNQLESFVSYFEKEWIVGIAVNNGDF
jgi:hypothetical protein